MRRLGLLFAIVCVATGIGVAFAGQCRAQHGMHATLFGGVDDPDVLVWDSRDRLITYAGGSSDTRAFLLPHAILNRPGTEAVAQACVPGIVHSKFHIEVEDAIGVLIESGRYRGRYGWIGSFDLHGPGLPEPRDQW